METAALEKRLGWTFVDPALLQRALTHRSWCAENPGNDSNERLEFLGDAVLGMVVAEQLIQRNPERSEGWLSRARSLLVRAGTLFELAQEIDLGSELLLGKGEDLTGGRTKPSILADAFEAVLGAIYLDGGLSAAEQVIVRSFAHRFSMLATADDYGSEPVEGDYKSRLQEYCARGGGAIPTYRWTEEGPEHAKIFTVEVVLNDQVLAQGTGRNKKQAEQSAAAQAFAKRQTETPE